MWRLQMAQTRKFCRSSPPALCGAPLLFLWRTLCYGGSGSGFCRTMQYETWSQLMPAAGRRCRVHKVRAQTGTPSRRAAHIRRSLMLRLQSSAPLASFLFAARLAFLFLAQSFTAWRQQPCASAQPGVQAFWASKRPTRNAGKYAHRRTLVRVFRPVVPLPLPGPPLLLPGVCTTADRLPISDELQPCPHTR